MTKLNIATFAVAAAALMGISAHADAIAYDNSAFAQRPTGGTQTNIYRIDGANRPIISETEIGDQITLQGGANTVTGFQFEYVYTGSPGAAAVVRFYNVAAGPSLVGSMIAGSQSAPLTLDFGHNKGTVTGLSVPVPGTFVWAIEFQNVGVGSVGGIDLYNGSSTPGSGPSIGSSFDDYFARTPSGAWTLYQSLDSQVIDNFGLQITVVPEPTTVALLTVGGLAIVAAARRRKA